MPAPPDELLSDLTDAQRLAVTHRDGALLVLAGPGSGKTTVVTRRIACLIGSGVRPWQILALTFTNKAAGEMRERVSALLGGAPAAGDGPTVATFHSFCARLLRRYAEAAGLRPGFSIYDESDRREAMKRAIQDAGLSTSNWAPGAVGAAISRAKNQLIDARALTAAATDFADRCIGRIYTAYEKIMRGSSAVDFDDLLLRTAAMLRSDEAVRRRLQERYRYLLIDEYQDTNHAQFVIAHTLAAAHGNICVVGDPDQSIYGWRGADLGNILEFEEHHPRAAVVPLGRNFRSTGHIVGAAASLIAGNRRRKAKRLYTELEDGDRPTAVICRDEHHEAEMVAQFLRREFDERALAWREMAILYRVNALSRVLEESMRRAQIPYIIARGTAFYERKEVRDALSYLRVIVNRDDDVSLGRIVNTPPRGIGKRTLEKIELHAIDRQKRLLEALRDAAGDPAAFDLSTRAAGAVRRFVEMLDGLGRIAAAPAEGPPSEALRGFVDGVVREAGLEAMYRGGSEEDRDRLANLGELISAAAEFVPAAEPDRDGPPSVADVLSHFLESVVLVSDADAIDPQRGSVTLMTLHAAKGLEFTAVAMIGLEEGLLPHGRAAASEHDLDLEEERRLCFVGMTRAKRRLWISRAAVRTHRGVRAATIESRFFGELPRDRVDVVDHSLGADSMAGDAGPPPDRTSEASEFPVGCIVRHPRFGLGRVESIMRRTSGSSARVAFPTAGTKTLILEHAPLERIR